MSSFIFPTAAQLIGITYNVKRTPTFQSRIQVAISGMETRIADWSFPRYAYELEFEFLRTDAVYQELQWLAAFYLSRQGSFDSFLFLDVDDDSATHAPLGTGDDVATFFQLARPYGATGQPAWTDPIYAPIVVTAVYVDNVVQDPADYTVHFWGSATPGQIEFVSPPAATLVVSADFTFVWPCRFADDTLELTKFMSQLWLAKKVSFLTIKAG